VEHRALVIGGAVVVAVALLTGCTASGGSIEDAGELVGGVEGQGFVSGDGTATFFPVDDRVAAPELAGTTLEGEPLAVSDFDGDVVVLNLWASWCVPCRAEAPVLQEVASETENDGVQFIGLNTDENQAAALAFESAAGITYPSLVDADGEFQLAFYDTVPAQSIPWTVIIDREGDIAARVIGETDYDQLSDLVDRVASER
jgi:thiol-disulfide isomerase/thioredoxin